MRAAAILLIVGSALAPDAWRQENADSIATALRHYLAEYERTMSTVIADEHYRQSETSFRPGGPANAIVRTRTLESEVSFLRLPNDREWFGVRNVLKVDRKLLRPEHRLGETLGAPGPSLEATVQAIVKASSAHNLGTARTINMPTVPLEVLHPRNHQRLNVTLGARETIAGTATREIRYREEGDQGLIRDHLARPMLTRGSAWVDAAGRLWRVTLRLEYPHIAVRNARTGDNELRVDFMFDRQLDMMLPREMREEFAVAGGGQFKGRATYSNFRRFTTSGKIIP
jgi:hypothetical protein